VGIPPVDDSAIKAALAEFDSSLRASHEFSGWEAHGAQLYAIEVDGQHYPPKKIISLATGVPVSEFSGGGPSNRYLKTRGFNVVEIRRPRVSLNRSTEVRFERGKVYDRWRDINEPFGGSRQSGIAPSQQVAAIFIFTGETGEQYGYRDVYDSDGVFSYTGEGQVGDMEFKRGNLAIMEHAKTGRALHLFKSLGRGEGQEYVGEFSYANHSFRRGPDRVGNERRLIIFHLVPVSLVADDVLHESDEDQTVAEHPEDLAAARAKALGAFVAIEGEAGRTALRNIYQRSWLVRKYVLLRAAGVCESCRQPAPFKRRDGSPYLEPHHTTRVSDGGLDHPRFIAAVCPSCHREIHHGLAGATKNELLVIFLRTLEPPE